jgi:hypothetical protein
VRIEICLGATVANTILRAAVLKILSLADHTTLAVIVEEILLVAIEEILVAIEEILLTAVEEIPFGLLLIQRRRMRRRSTSCWCKGIGTGRKLKKVGIKTGGNFGPGNMRRKKETKIT